MKTIFQYTLLSVLATASLCACSSSGKKSEHQTETERPAVEIVKIELLQPEHSLILPGELEGFYATAIYPKLNSYIRTILVDIGDQVKEGQLLVELEAPEIESQLSESFAKMKSAEAIYGATQANYRRLLQTNKTPGSVSLNDLEFAKANAVSDSLQLVSATVHYNAAKQTAGYLRITAPFDGIITERQLAPGDFVGPGERSIIPILKLNNESKLRLHIAIPEKMVSQVKEGNEIKFNVKSYPAQIFTGNINRISKNVDTKTRSEVIEILIDNQKGQLIPGMFASVMLDSRRAEKSLYVPQTAVVTNMEKCFVQKVDAYSKVHWVSVQKGNSAGDKVEVYGDLKEGDAVLKQANDEIKDEEVIKP